MTDFCRASRETRLEEELVRGRLGQKWDLPVIFHNIRLSKFSKEVFIVSDDDELEIRVRFTLIDDARQKIGRAHV